MKVRRESLGAGDSISRSHQLPEANRQLKSIALGAIRLI